MTNDKGLQVLNESAVGALLAKFGATLGVGVLGAVMLAAVSKEKMTRRDVAMRGLCAGIGSSVFGDAAVSFMSSSFQWFDPTTMTVGTWLLVGALSWGAFGALAELQHVLRTRGGQAVADRLLPPKRNDYE